MSTADELEAKRWYNGEAGSFPDATVDTFMPKMRGVFGTLIGECRRIEREHGFGQQSIGEDFALMHSELSEALEEHREGHAPNETYYNPEKPTKPEGIPSELADVIIRIMGFCARHNVDIVGAIDEKMLYNESRPFMHGGKVL